MKFKIFNNSNLNAGIEDMIQNLTVFAKDRFGFEQPPSFHLNSDIENAKDTFGKTGYYDPSKMEIHVYVDGRHDKDILRSIAHELVHHWQNEQGMLGNQGYSGPGYAQKNPHLRNMEKEAYQKGNMCFRDWEDSYKATNYNERGNIMSLKEWKNQQLNEALMKKWFGVIKENNNIEEEVVEESDNVNEEEVVEESENVNEETVEEGNKAYKRDEDYSGNKGDKPGWEKGNEDPKAKEDRGFVDDDGPKDYDPVMEEAVFQAVMKVLEGK